MNLALKKTVKNALLLLWEDIKSAKWVIIIIIAYFVLLKNFLYSLCPAVMLTGYPCPACGLTRAGFLLLRFQFREAFEMHPFIYPIVVLVLAFAVNRYVLLRNNKQLLQWCAILMITAMVLFYIWRMWNNFPGDPPMSYYSGNLWSRFGDLLRLR